MADCFPRLLRWRNICDCAGVAARLRLRHGCAITPSNTVMEEQTSPTSEQPTSGEEKWSQHFAQSLAERRQQALDLVAAQHQQFSQIEAELEAHLEDLEQRVAAGIADTDSQARTDLDQYAARLQQQAEEIAREQAKLTADRTDIASRQAEMQLAREQLAERHQELAIHQREEIAQLDRRATELHALEVKTKQAERALLAAQDEHQSEVRQLTSRRARFEEQQTRLESELEVLETRREDMRSQRRRIAQQLKIERAALAHDRELTRAEIDRQRQLLQADTERVQAQLREDRAALDQEMSRIRQQLRRDRQQLDEDAAGLEKTRRQWEEARRQMDLQRGDQSSELAAAQQEIRQLTAQLSQAQREVEEVTLRAAQQQQGGQAREQAAIDAAIAAGASHTDQDFVALQTEHDALQERVHELEQELTAAQRNRAAPAAADSQRMEDLQRRFEMAVDDVRQLKRRNSELEEQLAAQAAENRQPVVPAESGVQDWETTKRRMLAQLEGESHDEIGGMSHDERLTVEGAIRITDGMVVQRDREIAELKQLLAQQGHSTENAAAQSAVVEAMDHDEIIQQERQRLKELQDEWQEKLRQAEVDISVHRARIARERAELDERIRTFEAMKASHESQRGSSEPQETGKRPSKPTRNWLSRMGLKENDER